MRRLFICIMLNLAISTSVLFAQGVKVIYKEETKVPENIQQMDNPQIAAAVAAQLKQMNKTMVLYYDKGESLFEQLKTKGQEQPTTMGVQTMKLGGSGSCYKNLKTKESTAQEYIMDRAFLITEPLLTMNEWKLENETKKVGNYTCKKAVKDGNLTAWYSTELPVSDGPYLYCGLPGLILEIETPTKQITMQTIELKSQEVNGKIEVPKSGKKINRKEFVELMEKKKAEMGIKGEGNGVRVIRM